jgi:hypothetical protein
MDAYSILYGLWLGIFLMLRRTTIARIWPVYFIFLIIVLPIQYFCSIGLPPALCFSNITIFFFLLLFKLLLLFKHIHGQHL